jgi:hypothetical protein
MEVTDNPFARLATAQIVQNFVDEPDNMWTGKCTEEEFLYIRRYFKRHNLPTPKIPVDDRSDDVKKIMFRVMAATKCLDLMCDLLGVEEEPEGEIDNGKNV